MRTRKSFALRLLSWAHSMLIFEGVCVLFAGLLHLEGQELFLYLARGMTLIVPVVLTDILVRRCRSLWLFCLAGAALVWAEEILTRSRLIGWLAVFLCLFRCYVKLKQGEIRRRMREMPGEAGALEPADMWEVPTLLDSPHPVHGALFVLMYLGLVAWRCYRLLGPMLFLLAAEFIVCLAYGYLEQLIGFGEKNREVANLPVGAMKRTGAGILGAGVILLLAFMLPAVLYHEEPLTRIRFERQETEIIGGEEVYRESGEPDHLMEELLRIRESAKETPPWLKAASKLVCLLILAWIAYLALKMVFSAVKRASEAFAGDGEDEVIFLGKDEDKAAGRGRKAGGKKERVFSPDRRIRRIYKRAVRRRLKGNILGSETPLELEGKAGFWAYDAGNEKLQIQNGGEAGGKQQIQDDSGDGSRTQIRDSEAGGKLQIRGSSGDGGGTQSHPAGESRKKQDIGIAHELYEKARYGKEECTKEEVRQCEYIFSNFNR